MEPRYLDKLPTRFRARFRENLIVAAVVVALFVVPPRCGSYGPAAFSTIIWLTTAAFLIARLVRAQPPRPAWSFVLLGIMLALFGYPIVVGWITLSFTGGGALAFMGGGAMYVVFIIIERRAILPTMFGPQRSNPIKDFRAARAAQAAARLERAQRLETLRNAFRDPPRDQQ